MVGVERRERAGSTSAKTRASLANANANAKRARTQAWLNEQPIGYLACLVDTTHEQAAAAKSFLRKEFDAIWEYAVVRALKDGYDQDDAIELANREVGKGWLQRVANAKAGRFDAKEPTSSRERPNP